MSKPDSFSEHCASPGGSRLDFRLDAHPRHDFVAAWYLQWKSWVDNYDKMTVIPVGNLDIRANEGGDSLNLKAAYERGDMIYYHHFVPRHFIDFAEMCLRVAHG